MARSTQYIGLSPSAIEFLSKHKNKSIGSWKMTKGIGYEDVMGSIYEVEVGENCGVPYTETYVEIVDVEPWSSGPMIHTALRSLSSGEKLFPWKEDEIHWD